MIEVPIWLQFSSVLLVAFGHWKAGDGWRGGWVITTINHSMWFIFSVWTRQPAIMFGAIVFGLVAYRNARKGKRAFGTEASLESG